MEMVVDKEFFSISKERETLYSFLKIALEEPLTGDTLKLWKENFSSEFIDVLTEDNEFLHKFFETLKRDDLSSIEQQERDAYFATFTMINTNGITPAPPWESVYVTKDHSMFGDPVFQIRRKLDQFGLKFLKENIEPEDHISIEIEFLIFLINYTNKALEAGNKTEYEEGIYTQYWLLKEHLNRWIQPFAENILSSTTTSFYKGVAKLLYIFVNEDYEYMKSLKEGLENE